MARIMVDKDEFEELLAASQRPREDGEDMQTEEEEEKDAVAAAAPAADKGEDDSREEEGEDNEGGEGPDPDEEGEEEEEDDDEEAGDPTEKLPCRRIKQAAAFMRLLASGPQFGLKRGEIYLDRSLMGKVSTVLQHFFGPEKLTARQIRMAEAFLSKNKQSRREEGGLAPQTSAAKSAAKDDDRSDYHPELAAAWQKMGLLNRQPSAKRGRGEKSRDG